MRVTSRSHRTTGRFASRSHSVALTDYCLRENILAETRTRHLELNLEQAKLMHFKIGVARG